MTFIKHVTIFHGIDLWKAFKKRPWWLISITLKFRSNFVFTLRCLQYQPCSLVQQSFQYQINRRTLTSSLFFISNGRWNLSYSNYRGKPSAIPCSHRRRHAPMGFWIRRWPWQAIATDLGSIFWQPTRRKWQDVIESASWTIRHFKSSPEISGHTRRPQTMGSYSFYLIHAIPTSSKIMPNRESGKEAVKR